MNEPFDRALADWLREGPETGPREGLERALTATRRVGQRPMWTMPERWLPMQLTMARTRSQRPILALVLLALLVVALVASALFIGRLQPPPFRNGAVVYADGDLVIADQLGGTPRPLVPGPETDSNPVFSPQGDRIAFIRDGRQIMSVRPDGSDIKPLASLETVVRLGWSPDGTALLATTYSLEDLQALTVVQSDGSGSRTLDLDGIYTVSGSWRPNGRQIAFMGWQAGDLAAFIADADGTNVRPLGFGPAESKPGLEWSPDGRRLGFMSPGGVISIADIAEDGAVTALRQPKLELDPETTPTTNPKWSPDGSQLAFAVRTPGPDFDGSHGYLIRVAIAEADGSRSRLVGPVVGTIASPADLAWSPDGRSLIVGEVSDDQASDFTRLSNVWSVDVATGEQTEIGTPLESWQRLAP